jgi:NADH dehydrogenase (ubiquinone) 1 alpha subcomplex subunit 5
MRSTIARLANPSRFLTPGNPTGLTGLLTHPSPRTTLVVLYTSTLSKLKQFPAHSSYRTAVEALTKHRLNLVESYKPARWEEWNSKAQEVLKKYPTLFAKPGPRVRYVRQEVEGKPFVTERLVRQIDPETQLEWNGEKFQPFQEGPGRKNLGGITDVDTGPTETDVAEENWIPEPKLEATQ